MFTCICSGRGEFSLLGVLREACRHHKILPNREVADTPLDLLLAYHWRYTKRGGR
jgi:hypothetical protein